MPALAREFEVIAVDQRGIGLTGKPQDRYDTGTLAGDLVALLDALGHERFAWDTTLVQNEQRATRPLAMPVLAIGGAESWGEAVRYLATDVQVVVSPAAATGPPSRLPRRCWRR